jgi:hypothetical protein
MYEYLGEAFPQLDVRALVAPSVMERYAASRWALVPKLSRPEWRAPRQCRPAARARLPCCLTTLPRCHCVRGCPVPIARRR